jgi:hypothetical protein
MVIEQWNCTDILSVSRENIEIILPELQLREVFPSYHRMYHHPIVGQDNESLDHEQLRGVQLERADP